MHPENKRGEHMKVENLKPRENNPRKITSDQLEKLKESISRDPEFMRYRPIVYDPDNENEILGGTQRYKACCALGYDEVPNEWVKSAKDLTEEQKRRFVVVDNSPSGAAGDWDYETLAHEFGSDELADYGFLKDELDAIFAESQQAAEPEEQPEVEFSEEMLLEHNYIVLTFSDPMTWQVALDKFGLKQVKDLIPRKNQPTGTGRVIDGSKVLERLENAE